MNAEPSQSDGGEAEQINALLGDANTLRLWYYPSLLRLTASHVVIDLQLAHETVCSSPQATNSLCYELCWPSPLRSSTACRPIDTPPSVRTLRMQTYPALAWLIGLTSTGELRLHA